MFKKLFAIGFIFLFLAFSIFAQREVGVRPTASGGVLMPEQAAYDVLSYDLDLRPNIAEQTIKGVLTVKAKIVKPIDKFVLDLDTPLTVETVALVNGKKETPLTFERREGKIRISFRQVQAAGKTVEVRV